MSRQAPPEYTAITEPTDAEAGLLVSKEWSIWLARLATDLQTLEDASTAGYSGTIPLAKITGGGTDGSITVVNGLITAATVPT